MKKLFFIVLIILFIVPVCIFVFMPKYPLKFKTSINKYAQLYELEPHFVAAVIFAESSFNENAVSNKGAMGLMQLLPTTAEEIATKMGYKDYSSEKLLNPDINILFGCYYLRYLFNKYSNKGVILACYNAGLGVVGKWLSSEEYSLDGKTLINVPYAQTENYIIKVTNAEKYYKGKL